MKEMAKIKDLYCIEEVLKDKYFISNALGKSIEVNYIAHYGNCPCVEIPLENQSVIFPAVGSGQVTVGYILQGLIELFDMDEEDGLRISKIKNFPMRVVRESAYGKIIAVGHFTKDRFILIDDLNMFAFTKIKEFANN